MQSRQQIAHTSMPVCKQTPPSPHTSVTRRAQRRRTGNHHQWNPIWVQSVLTAISFITKRRGSFVLTTKASYMTEGSRGGWTDSFLRCWGVQFAMLIGHLCNDGYDGNLWPQRLTIPRKRGGYLTSNQNFPSSHQERSSALLSTAEGKTCLKMNWSPGEKYVCPQKI